MTDEELIEALRGLYAYDTGSRDSGIHDAALRARCVAELKRRIEPYPYRLLGCDPATTRLVRDAYLSEQSIDLGYSLEDVRGFVAWMTDDLGD